MRSTRPLIPASIAAALMVSGLAGAAIAKDKGMHDDKCGPGPQMIQKMFERHDADGDGKISAEEMAAGPQRRFAAMDGDGDGKASAAEMVAHHMAMMQAHVETRVAAMIAEMDDDGDGALSAAEMGPGRRAERRAEKRGAAMFDRMDADDDGFVTLAEAEAGAAKMARGGHGRYGRDDDGEGRGKMHHGEGGHGEGHHGWSEGRGMQHGRGMGECPETDDE